MNYKFKEFKWLATSDGFNYPVDVYYGETYIGTLVAEANGFYIKLVDSPEGKKFLDKTKKYLYKSERLAAESLHQIWKSIRTPEEPIKEIALADFPPQPSNHKETQLDLLIPDYEDDNEKYPGDITPGYYNPENIMKLVLFHLNNPEALEFIADMLEVGNPKLDEFSAWLRKNKNNKNALSKIGTMWMIHPLGNSI